jgi:hypothetical protein
MEILTALDYLKNEMPSIYNGKDIPSYEIAYAMEEYLNYRFDQDKKDYAIRFSNWLDKNYIKKKGAYYHKGDWEFSNGENNKKKLLLIFNHNVE